MTPNLFGFGRDIRPLMSSSLKRERPLLEEPLLESLLSPDSEADADAAVAALQTVDSGDA